MGDNKEQERIEGAEPGEGPQRGEPDRGDSNEKADDKAPIKEPNPGEGARRVGEGHR